MEDLTFPVEYVGYKIQDQAIDMDKGTIVIHLRRRKCKSFYAFAVDVHSNNTEENTDFA